MGFHIGEPENPGIIRFLTDSVLARTSKRSWRQDRFVTHKIKSLLGISFGSRWYFGLIRLSDTETHFENIENNKLR